MATRISPSQARGAEAQVGTISRDRTTGHRLNFCRSPRLRTLRAWKFLGNASSSLIDQLAEPITLAARFPTALCWLAEEFRNFSDRIING